MESIYKTLIEVRIWHEYDVGTANPDFFEPPLDGPIEPMEEDSIIPNDNPPGNYDITRFFEINPTKETEQLLTNYRCRFRKNRFGFNIYVEVKEVEGNENEFKTLIPFSENLQLSFIISLKDPYFLNYTNLPFFQSKKKIYYSNNLEKDQMAIITEGEEELLFLSKATKICEGECDYSTFRIGDIISNIESQLFEVIDLPIEEDPDPDVDSQQSWQRIRRKTHFVSRQDAIDLSGTFYEYEGVFPPDFDPDLDAREVFEVIDIHDEIVKLGYQSFEEDGGRIPLELPNYMPSEAGVLRHKLPFFDIPSGKYTIDFFGEQVAEFFHLNLQQFPNAFYALELFSIVKESGAIVPEAFSFIDEQVLADGSRQYLIKPKVFHLHFKNRLSYWKYFSAQEKEVLIHEQPKQLALSKKFTEISVATVNNGNFLPNPSVQHLSIEIEHTQDIEKEIYISKIFV